MLVSLKGLWFYLMSSGRSKAKKSSSIIKVSYKHQMDFLDAVLALKYPPVNAFTDAKAEKSSDGKGRVFINNFVCFFSKNTFLGLVH